MMFHLTKYGNKNVILFLQLQFQIVNMGIYLLAAKTFGVLKYILYSMNYFRIYTNL